jgi:class 3 adenylate cyclase
VLDIDAVLRAARVRQCYMWASTLSGPQAILYATGHPRRMLGLMLYGTFSRATDVLPADAIRGMAEFVRRSPDFALGALIGNDPANIAGTLRLAEVYRQSADGDTVADFLLAGCETDVTASLSQVRCPTLVLHRVGDTVVPFAVGQALASRLPNATFVPLQGAAHAYTFGDSALVLEAIEAFTGTNPAPSAPPPTPRAGGPAFRTVLFTDLVGHTEMMQRLGDEAGRQLLREHERITRDTLKQHGGAEVKTMGDGFMASFGSVTKAIDCAIALQRAFAAHTESMSEPLHVRVGLNAGEPIEEDGDLFGSTVILASRIAAKADAGEILIPEPLRHLLTGKSYVYADRGETLLKGFEDALRLYEVNWRD